MLAAIVIIASMGLSITAGIGAAGGGSDELGTRDRGGHHDSGGVLAWVLGGPTDRSVEAYPLTIGGDLWPRLPGWDVYVHQDGPRSNDSPQPTVLLPREGLPDGLTDAMRPESEAIADGEGWVEAEFRRGYLDAGGDLNLLRHFTSVVIPCESGWNPLAVSNGGHLGLVQFAAGSWRAAGGGDWRDPYQQGANTARWAAMTTPSEQWSCW